MAQPSDRGEFIVRLALPTAILGVSLWYLGSLWNVPQSARNLIMILPVVIAMVPFWIWIMVYEIRRDAALRRGESVLGGVGPANNDHLRIMAVAIGMVALFPVIGAVPVSVLALAAGLFVLRIRSAILIVVLPLAATLVFWAVFIEVFGIRMPLFRWPF